MEVIDYIVNVFLWSSAFLPFARGGDEETQGTVEVVSAKLEEQKEERRAKNPL